jgi:hypothetical protein
MAMTYQVPVLNQYQLTLDSTSHLTFPTARWERWEGQVAGAFKCKMVLV